MGINKYCLRRCHCVIDTVMGASKSKPKPLGEVLSDLETALDEHEAAMSAAWGLPVMAKPTKQEVDKLIAFISEECVNDMKRRLPPAGTNPVA